MKRVTAILTAVVLLAVMLAVPITAGASYLLPEDVAVNARSALLMYVGSDPTQDAVLFEREADVRRSPSATVRVMVGLYAIREIRARNLDIDTATGVYDRSCYLQITGTGLGVVGMQIGDTWTLRDLLTATMAETAADACVALCTAVSGSVTAFLDGMNHLAKELGCHDTAFANVTGLDALGQYTTARDLAKIMREAMEYPELTAMMGVRNYEVTPIVGAKQQRATVNSMLRPITDSYYSKLECGRTGYAEEAGRCMVSVAKDGGYRYMAVVLGSAAADGTDRAIAHFEDTQNLYEWAFKNFSYKILLSEGQPVSQLPVDLAWSQDTVVLVTGGSFGTVVPNELDASTVILKPVLNSDKAVDAPIQKGGDYGRVELYIQLDQKIGEVPMIAGSSVERSNVLLVWRYVQRVFTSVWLYIGIGLFLLLVAGYVALSVVHNRRRRRRRKGGRK
ncbi:MAG: D-alanyl-D-alanine carboxypeptidase [Ruminococcaceae bacterium]|nr:D-alanyl-D-alanine carboxypeptidase [Oscillospiraceae bacterium]